MCMIPRIPSWLLSFRWLKASWTYHPFLWLIVLNEFAGYQTQKDPLNHGYVLLNVPLMPQIPQWNSLSLIYFYSVFFVPLAVSPLMNQISQNQNHLNLPNISWNYPSISFPTVSALIQTHFLLHGTKMIFLKSKCNYFTSLFWVLSNVTVTE
jgi:hypothetical protein